MPALEHNPHVRCDSNALHSLLNFHIHITNNPIHIVLTLKLHLPKIHQFFTINGPKFSFVNGF